MQTNKTTSMTTTNKTTPTTKTTKCTAPVRYKFTKIKQPTVVSRKVCGVSTRGIKLENNLYYFVSDLVEGFGRGFLKSLESSIIKMRIKDKNNSQTRRLVKATDLPKKMSVRS
jgi:hypothetical protein